MPTKNVVIFGTMTWAEEPGDVNRPAFPTNPIAPGGTTPPWGLPGPINPIAPDGIWGGSGTPLPGYGLPGHQPGVGRPGFPTNPIAPGGTTPPWGIPIPPGYWGGSGEGFPGYGPPGNQPGVGYPGFPTPPIYVVGDGGAVAPPASGVPVEGTLTFYEGKGYVFKPEGSKPPEGGETPDAEPKPDRGKPGTPGNRP